jgi:hypothetical protein
MKLIFLSFKTMKLVMILAIILHLVCAVKLKIMNSQIAIVELHKEYKVWLNKLLFYKDDLKTMQSRLDEIASRNNSKLVFGFFENFENQFKIQNEQIDILNIEIKQHKYNIEDSIINNPIPSIHKEGDDHVEERNKMMRFEELFSEFKNEILSI